MRGEGRVGGEGRRLGEEVRGMEVRSVCKGRSRGYLAIL